MISNALIQNIPSSSSISQMSNEIAKQIQQYGFLKLECLEEQRCPSTFFDSDFKTYPVYYAKHYKTNDKIFKAPYGVFDILGEKNCPKVLLQTVKPILIKLMEAFSVFLGKNKDYLFDISKKNNYQIYAYAREKQFIHHIKNELVDGEISFEPHKDISLFTFSFIPEIEVLSPDKKWLRYQDEPNTYAVWVGSQMEELTNNKIKSTIHRVRRFDSSNVLFFGKLEINTNLVCNETAR
jgi:hypothetical protein